MILVFAIYATSSFDVGLALSCLGRAIEEAPVKKALRGAIRRSQPCRILRNWSTLSALADQSVTSLAGSNSSVGPVV